MARIIGLDLGSVTCGVAISDATGLVARTLKTIRFPSEDYDICFDEVLDLLEKNQVKNNYVGGGEIQVIHNLIRGYSTTTD